jgi:hypothetical protein
VMVAHKFTRFSAAGAVVSKWVANRRTRPLQEAGSGGILGPFRASRLEAIQEFLGAEYGPLVAARSLSDISLGRVNQRVRRPADVLPQ